MYIQVSPLSPVTLMTDYLARMNTALKGTAGLRDVNGLISLKAIQSIDTARLRRWIIYHLFRMGAHGA